MVLHLGRLSLQRSASSSPGAATQSLEQNQVVAYLGAFFLSGSLVSVSLPGSLLRPV